MNHRRLRLPAAMALLALAAPVFAADPGETHRSNTAADIHREARDVSDSVRQGTRQFGHDVAQGFHQFGHEVQLRWHQAGHSVRQWWINTRQAASRT
jgi:hypothetical protein